MKILTIILGLWFSLTYNNMYGQTGEIKCSYFTYYKQGHSFPWTNAESSGSQLRGGYIIEGEYDNFTIRKDKWDSPYIMRVKIHNMNLAQTQEEKMRRVELKQEYKYQSTVEYFTEVSFENFDDIIKEWPCEDEKMYKKSHIVEATVIIRPYKKNPEIYEIYFEGCGLIIEIQQNPVYKYGVYELDKKIYLRNLSTNVNGWLNAQYLNQGQREEFIKAYNKVIAALKEDGRLSADDFGTIIDSKGELGNIDEDDYWYDKRGNRISGREYWKLSDRKRKKYKSFAANRLVARYFKEIADAIIAKINSNH